MLRWLKGAFWASSCEAYALPVVYVCLTLKSTLDIEIQTIHERQENSTTNGSAAKETK